MSKDAYKWTSIVLAIVVVGLVIYIATRPRPVNSVALKQDLADFSMQLQSWDNQYTANPTVQGQQQLVTMLNGFQQKLQTDEYQ